MERHRGRVVAALGGGLLLAGVVLFFLPVFPNRGGARQAASSGGAEAVEAEEAPDRLRPERPPPPPAWLDGRPFPRREPFEPEWPEAKRVRYASASAGAEGDGSEARPWSDLPKALAALEPGDRLVLLPGRYTSPIRIEPPCRDGAEGTPIQVLVLEGAIFAVEGDVTALTVQRAFWSFRGITIEPPVPDVGAGIQMLGVEAHDIGLDRFTIVGGRGPGIRVGSGSRRVTISNGEIRGLRGGGFRRSNGIEVHARVTELTVAGNEIHHNQGSSIYVGGSRGKGKGIESHVEKLTIVGNTFHGDGMHGVKIKGGSRNVRIADNLIYDYRPYRSSRGAGILIYPNIREVVIEGNHVADVPIGVLLGTTEPGTGVTSDGPRHVAIRRNYLECRLPSEGHGVLVNSGQDIRIRHNVVDGCAEAFRILARPPGEGISIGNNLVLGVSGLAFLVTDPITIADFDDNVFKAPGGALRMQFGEEKADLRGYLARGRMPRTTLAASAALEGRDVGRVTGVPVVDRGRAFEDEEEEPRGSAPDIGIAEH